MTSQAANDPVFEGHGRAAGVSTSCQGLQAQKSLRATRGSQSFWFFFHGKVVLLFIAASITNKEFTKDLIKINPLCSQHGKMFQGKYIMDTNS